MPKRPEQGKWPAILQAMHKTADAISPLDADSRNAVLCGLLAQEICKLPVAERPARLAEITAELPGILHSTEQSMRMALNENARNRL